MKRKCPKCKSTNLETQRRMDGDSRCKDCGYRGKTTEFDSVPNELKIYIIICQDRHSDTTAEPFLDKDKAIAEARRLGKEYARDPEDYQEEEQEDWLFYARYSCESDCVWVTEHTIKKDDK